MSVKYIAETVDKLLSSGLDPHQVREQESSWSADLWQRLYELGMTTIDVPEASGGGGGEIHEALEVVRLCGYHNANLPIVDAAFVGSWLRGLAGLPPADRPDAVMMDERESLKFDDSEPVLRVSGPVSVGWIRGGGELLVICEAPTGVRLVHVADPMQGGCNWSHGRNLAGEPRDHATLKDMPATEIRGLQVSHMQVLARRGLGTATLMLGALERVVDLALTQAQQREQFGRSLSEFQVIQHYLAKMVGQVAAVRSAVKHASITASPTGIVEIEAAAAARVCAGVATEMITELGHQIHGAIGVTMEHELGLSTRRLWAWRDEERDQQYWAGVLGRMMATRAHTSGLWAVMEKLE